VQRFQRLFISNINILMRIFNKSAADRMSSEPAQAGR
jgi:hypothetical protein